MNATLLHKFVTLRSRIVRLLIVPALAIGFAIPAAEARPGRDRDHGYHGYRGGHSARYHPEHRGYHGDRHRGYGGHHVRRVPIYSAPYYRPAYYQPRYISALPRGCREVYRGGVRYYYSNGYHYRPHYRNNSQVFIQLRF